MLPRRSRSLGQRAKLNDLQQYEFYKQLKAFHKKDKKALTQDVSNALKYATTLPIEKCHEISHLFVWNNSPEGHEYWRLRDVAL